MAEMSMVERVGMALHDEWFGVGNWSSLTDHQRKRWVYMARAAIEAMREPTEAMRMAADAARNAALTQDENDQIGALNAAIDAALAAALSEEVAG